MYSVAKVITVSSELIQQVHEERAGREMDQDPTVIFKIPVFEIAFEITVVLIFEIVLVSKYPSQNPHLTTKSSYSKLLALTKKQVHY